MTKPGPGPSRTARLLGLDRSGPQPVETRQGQPLRPFTVPNFVGYVRLLGIPAFLLVAMSSEDGRDPVAIALFTLIAAGDYVDGILARITGQYSRLGALMDPVVDRLTILSGAAVAWHFELLPRWAIAALAAREVLMLGVAQWGLRRGVDISVNWPGRIAVFPVMASFPLAMLAPGTAADLLLVSGVALATLALGLYIRAGLSAQGSTSS